MSETLLDVQGLSCPLPVLKANKALRGLPPGAALVVLATDPAARRDFPAFCAALAFCWLLAANSSCICRVIWNLVATFSAVVPMW